MINLYELVPTIYLQASRDFQYLGWLINIVLNSVKHNVDGLYELPKSSIDAKISELLAFTLGFKVRRNYNQDQLIALASIIPSILKYKGTKYALILAGNALIKASGAIGECMIIDDEEALKNGTVKVLLPKDLVDTTLFLDLLPYILPAGMTCSIVRKTAESSGLDTVVSYQQAIIAQWHKDIELTDTQVKGVSGLFEGNDTKLPSLANYTKDTTGKYVLNAGLLDNTIIPLIDEPLRDFSFINEENS